MPCPPRFYRSLERDVFCGSTRSKHCSSHLLKNSFNARSRSRNLIHILSIISSSTHFSLSAGILMHMHQPWLLSAISSPNNNHPLLHFYSINVSFHTHLPHNICLVIVGILSVASKDQSETGSLITIPYFSSRILNSRSRRIPGDIRTSVSLFVDYREHTAHHLHYSLLTYFPILFTIVLF